MRRPGLSGQHGAQGRRWRRVIRPSIVVVAIAVCAQSLLGANSWPTYRGDYTRSGYAAGQIPAELTLLWTHEPKQPPSPAWPAPARGSYWQRLARIAPRIVDDHAFHPVAAAGCLLYGSSADDSLVCLDQQTGQLRWRFTTDGPVRYAPTVAGGLVYVGSDDGSVYCIDLANGALRWSRQLAPAERLVPGNGRIISAWPVRTSVAVVDGVAYAAAGLYPTQGVYLAALAAETGEARWRQELEFTAHGYLLVSQDRLVIPTGRSTPILVSRRDGQLIGQIKGLPGSYAVVAQDEVLSGPGNDGAVGAADLQSGESLVTVPAQHVCVSPELAFLSGGGQLRAIDLRQFMQLSRQINELQRAIDPVAKKVEKLSLQPASSDELQAATARLTELTGRRDAMATQRDDCLVWKVKTTRHGSLVATSNAVVVGGSKGAEIRDPRDGRLLDELPVEGAVLGSAIADDQVFLSTDQGRIYCFGSPTAKRSADSATTESGITSDARPWRESVERLLREDYVARFGSTKGFAVVAGADDPTLIAELCEASELTILVVDTDLRAVAALRDLLIEQGVYGRRVAVRHVDPGALPIADYVGNLVVSTRGVAGQAEDRWPADELKRLVRPAGGLAWFDDEQRPAARAPLAGAGSWVHQYGNLENSANSGDELISWDLQLQWFGGPGPSRMVDRHLRAPAPLVAGGRMFVGGENSLVCVDSYNGVEYWSLELPTSQRYSMPYDCGYASLDGETVTIAVGGAAWVIDAKTGQRRHELPVPTPDGETDAHWGYLAVRGDEVLGSVQKPTASRTTPSRDRIDRDYANSQPLVTGTAVFAMDRESQEVRWQHDAIVLNPTITVTKEFVYFVAAEAALKDHPTGRIPLGELLEGRAELKAIEIQTGALAWSCPLEPHLLACRSILYLQAVRDRLVLSGSYEQDNDSRYRVAVVDAASGDTLWTAEHSKGKPGEFTHGEQVHHPVILGDRLICEPALYDLESGQRLDANGQAGPWMLTRPAHSCGTMSGAGDCLFFRSGNPTVLKLGSDLEGQNRFRSIAPTRPGCWINIIPADGLVLIPEASASCVCHYSLQTSMAFQPKPTTTTAEPISGERPDGG